ncbi:MAG TPA: tetratricopeptide repeat protein [Bryobacteraceae bacterium]
MPEALSSLEQALKLDPKLIPALTLYAKIAMSMNRLELARESLERALAVDPKAAYARFLYGLSYYLGNDLAHALPEFERARAANPKDGRASLYLGLTYESTGRTGEAMRMYEESVRVGPSTEGYLAGARLLYLEGRLDECERWIRDALKLEPDSRDAHFELARLLLREQKMEPAAMEGERALELREGAVTDSQIHYLLIRAYRDIAPALSRQHAEALRLLEEPKK